MAAGALREVFAHFGFSFDKAGLANVDNAVKRTTANAAAGVSRVGSAVSGIGGKLAGVGKRLGAGLAGLFAGVGVPVSAPGRARASLPARAGVGVGGFAPVPVGPAVLGGVNALGPASRKASIDLGALGKIAQLAAKDLAVLGQISRLVARDLGMMGSSGRAASTAIGGIAASSTKANAAMNSAAVGSKRVAGGMKQATAAGVGLQAGIGALGSVFAGSIALGFLSSIEKTGSGLKDLSDQIGVDTKTIQVFRHTLGSMGVESGEADVAFRKFALAISNAEGGAQEQIKTLKVLGVATRDSGGSARKAGDILDDTFAAFGNVDPIKRAALAQDLFGRGALKLLPLLSQGKEGIKKAREELELLGGGFSEQGIEAADLYGDSLHRLQTSLIGLKSSIAVSVFPVLTRLAERASVGMGQFKKWADGTTLFKTGIFALAAAIAGPLLKALKPLLLPGLKFLAIFLAVDDVVAFLRGEASVIEDILDGIKPGSAKGVRDFLNGIEQDVSHFIDGLKGDNAGAARDIDIAWEGYLNGSMLKQWGDFTRKAGDQLPGLLGAFFKFQTGVMSLWVILGTELVTGFEMTGRQWDIFVAKWENRWNEAVLGAIETWNGFVESVLGTKVFDLRIDTGSAKAELDASKKRLEGAKKDRVVNRTLAQEQAAGTAGDIRVGQPAAFMTNPSAFMSPGMASLPAAGPVTHNVDNRKVENKISVPVTIVKDRDVGKAAGNQSATDIATKVSATTRKATMAALEPRPA